MDSHAKIRVIDESLVVSLPQPHQVVSWAPLHGGFRNGVAHIVVHRVASTVQAEGIRSEVRQVIGRLGLRGTVVGMGTTEDVRAHAAATAQANGVALTAISVAPPGFSTAPANWNPETVSAMGSISLVLVLNKRVSHEFMLEALAAVVETKTRARWRGQQQDGPDFPLIWSPCDCVAIAATEETEARFLGTSELFKVSMARTFSRVLRRSH